MTLQEWLKEIVGQAGPDVDEVRIRESNEVTILCSISSTRVFSMARALVAAGHKVTVLNGDNEVDFNQAHYSLSALDI
jgi:hypothetical protein